MNEHGALIKHILDVLADEQPHDIAELCEIEGSDRQTIDELLAVLQDIGLGLVSGDNTWQWQNPRKLIDAYEIASALPAEFKHRLNKISVDYVCDSTNERIAELGSPAGQNVHLSVAEYQTTGRGRRGRTWDSPFGSGICMTLAIPYVAPGQADSALTLAIGIAIAEALGSVTNDHVLLKWPNDLVLKDHKLGGILTELVATETGDYVLNIGVGINIDPPDLTRLQLQDHALMPARLGPYLHKDYDRAQLIALLVYRITNMVEEFRLHGFGNIIERWNRRDYLRHEEVQVFASDHVVNGYARGIDELGALIVEVNGERQQLFSGDVRVRKRV